MTIAALAMNLTLIALLLAALAFGWRLERRLKALRAGHEGFAKAVRDLDAAAARAEQGLADLRAATDEATDLLADRIEKARALTAKLDRQLAQPAPANQPDELLLSTPVRSTWAPPRETPKSRARIDDDLFDDPAPLRSIAGGRR